MNRLINIGLVVLLLVAALPADAAQDQGDWCSCRGSTPFGNDCAASGPCPCECRCPFIGNCHCSCSGGVMIFRPPNP